MNDFHDTAEIPDFSRKIYLVKKDRKGHNDWYELDLSDKTILEDDICFDIAPADDWTKSLIQIKDKQDE